MASSRRHAAFGGQPRPSALKCALSDSPSISRDRIFDVSFYADISPLLIHGYDDDLPNVWADLSNFYSLVNKV